MRTWTIVYLEPVPTEVEAIIRSRLPTGFDLRVRGRDETVHSAGNVDLGPGVTVKDLALGGAHTCALLTTGAVRCWGRNDYGQLGYGHSAHLGDNEPINNLQNVSLTGTVRKVVTGEYRTALSPTPVPCAAGGPAA